MRTAIVLPGGDPIHWGTRVGDLGDVIVIAADSGLHNADGLGRPVDFVVGDLDSADPARVAAAEAAGARVERHPPDKDATDFELALDVAKREGVQQIVVHGGVGGRLDHFLGNVLVLASPAYAGIRMLAFMGDARIEVARGGESAVMLYGTGSLVTLLPVGGPARGIVTEGLQYPLRDETLTPGTTRGVSNVLATNEASVVLADGTLLVIHHPGEIT